MLDASKVPHSEPSLESDLDIPHSLWDYCSFPYFWRVSVRPRKSLGFGPVHPNAVFVQNPVQTVQLGVPQETNPLAIALRFATELIPSHLQDTTSFILRKDSYTDKNTGVTHTYLRQYIRGFEVADGDVNVNVMDELVLSYGDSVCITTSFNFSKVSCSCSNLY
jgi:hypothetical protein